MLTSLGIRNYRNLKSLDIERLARVNLIAGKNNIGKTSLLEAVSLYAAGGDIQWINGLLTDRDEVIVKSEENGRPVAIRLIHPDSYKALFYNREARFSNQERITIGSLKNDLFEKSIVDADDRITLQLIRFVRHKIDTDIGRTIQTVILKDNEEASNLIEFRLGIELQIGKKSIIHNLENERLRRISYQYSQSDNEPNFRYVKTGDTEDQYNSILWDNIALTENESYVVEALKIIDNTVERIAFVSKESNRDRKPVVKLKKQRNVVALKSMGDGMNRILTIVLALVNASDGYLLIDEFENGLYHRVQEDLWTMIFKLAQELNVQVFATTHSDDCIRAFEHVLSKGNQKEGQFIRLEKDEDTIYPVLFDAKQLQVATDHAIEIR